MNASGPISTALWCLCCCCCVFANGFLTCAWGNDFGWPFLCCVNCGYWNHPCTNGCSRTQASHCCSSLAAATTSPIALILCAGDIHGEYLGDCLLQASTEWDVYFWVHPICLPRALQMTFVPSGYGASLEDFLGFREGLELSWPNYFLQVAHFPKYHTSGWLHTSASSSGMVGNFPFQMMLFGIIAPGEDVHKLLGSWPGTGGIDLGLLGKCWLVLNHWSSGIHLIPARERENRVLQLADARFQPCQLISPRPTRWEKIDHSAFRGPGLEAAQLKHLGINFFLPGGERQAGKVDSQFFVLLWAGLGAH